MRTGAYITINIHHGGRRAAVRQMVPCMWAGENVSNKYVKVVYANRRRI